jgi:hypothetical protein
MLEDSRDFGTACPANVRSIAVAQLEAVAEGRATDAVQLSELLAQTVLTSPLFRAALAVREGGPLAIARAVQWAENGARPRPGRERDAADGRERPPIGTETLFTARATKQTRRALTWWPRPASDLDGHQVRLAVTRAQHDGGLSGPSQGGKSLKMHAAEGLRSLWRARGRLQQCVTWENPAHAALSTLPASTSAGATFRGLRPRYEDVGVIEALDRGLADRVVQGVSLAPRHQLRTR